MINTITGKVPSVTGKIRGNSPEERVGKWRDHFSSLLGQPPPVENPDDIITDPFTLEEYRIAKTGIKEGKACGDDNIAPEILKRCDLDQIVMDFWLCNQALTKGEKPNHWSTSNIIPLPKRATLVIQRTTGE